MMHRNENELDVNANETIMSLNFTLTLYQDVLGVGCRIYVDAYCASPGKLWLFLVPVAIR